MQYRLITTQNGQVPIQEITEGTLVYSFGKWVPSVKPIKTKCIKCVFETLPTTIFQKELVENITQVSVNHKPILNPHTESHPELSVRGYLKETASRKHQWISFLNKHNELNYWYPLFVRFFGVVMPPAVKPQSFSYYCKYPEITELSGYELSERNLEYYLEGILRKRFTYQDKEYKLPEVLDESDKLVLRLLDIDVRKVSLGTAVSNEISFLKHIRDSHNKSKITPEMVQHSLIVAQELPQYTPNFKIVEKQEVEDWILPNINPDINCINPMFAETDINTQQVRIKCSQKQDSLGRKLPYDENNLYEKLLRKSL